MEIKQIKIELKNNRLNYICKKCKNKWTKLINEAIKEFPHIYQFCNGDHNKFLLLLRKGVYPYEHIDNWKRFNETSLPPKEAFYSELNLEDIKDEYYEHAQKVWEVFEIKNLGGYHDLYVQSDTLLLADVFETLEISVLKHMSSILVIFCLHRDQHGKLA